MDVVKYTKSYTIHAALLYANFLDGSHIYVREQYQKEFLPNKQEDKTVYSFDNYTNSALVLSHATSIKSNIDISQIEGSTDYEINVSKTYNGPKN